MVRPAAAASAAALLLVGVLAAAARAQSDDGTYSSRYDEIDLDAILSNPSQVEKYVNCFLKTSDDDCDEMGKRVKAVLPEALPSNCSRCTARQRAGMARIVRLFSRERPEQWRELQRKYDPDNKYARANPGVVKASR